MIEIRDVAPRDGLQSETPVPPAERAALAVALADAGLAHVEAASFVSPKAVPAMAGGGEVVAALPSREDVTWWALVPNARGAELALEAGVRHLTVTISASEAYSVKNVGRPTDDAIAALADIASAASAGAAAAVDVVVSCAFGSPFEDVHGPEPTTRIVTRCREVMPQARLTLADTTGTATPRRLREVVAALGDETDLGLHLHDTRATALVNAIAAIELGVRRFDTAVGGLGGSPFAPGAGGNLATEDLVLLLDDLGEPTGVDLGALLAISARLPELVGHAVPSRVAAAGRLPAFGGAP